MGIHGEPGAEKQLLYLPHSQDRTQKQAPPQQQQQYTRDLVSLICTRLDHALHMKADLVARCTGLAVMVNNLGAVSQSEMLIVVKAVADFLYRGDAGVFNGHRFRVHVFSGAFMTSLQMTGVSVSCFMLPTDNGIMEQFLHAPTECIAWNAGFELFPPNRRSVVPRINPQDKTALAQQSRNVYFPTMTTVGGAAASTMAVAGTGSISSGGGTAIATMQQMQMLQPQSQGGTALAQQQATATAPLPQPAVLQKQQQQHVPPPPPPPISQPQLQPLPQLQQQQMVYTVPRPPQQFPHSNSSMPVAAPAPPKIYAGAKALSGAASTITGLSPSTEMNILTITSSLQSHYEDLTILDRKTGDGDLGDTGKSTTYISSPSLPLFLTLHT